MLERQRGFELPERVSRRGRYASPRR
jgi:hypothetical protein